MVEATALQTNTKIDALTTRLEALHKEATATRADISDTKKLCKELGFYSVAILFSVQIYYLTELTKIFLTQLQGAD